MKLGPYWRAYASGKGFEWIGSDWSLTHLMLYLQVLGEEASHPGVIDPEELDPLRRPGHQGYIPPNQMLDEKGM